MSVVCSTCSIICFFETICSGSGRAVRSLRDQKLLSSMMIVVLVVMPIMLMVMMIPIMLTMVIMFVAMMVVITIMVENNVEVGKDDHVIFFDTHDD